MWNKLGSCFISLVLALGSLPLHSEESTYWTIDQFQEKYPAQKQIAAAFSNIVHDKAKPLTLPQTAPVKIQIVYPSKQITDYWKRSIASFEARMNELQISYNLHAHHTRAVVATKQQHKLLDLANSFKPDYLIFTLALDEHQEFIEQILQQADAPKVILQNITTPIKKWQDHQPFLYVGFDHLEGTQLLADYYIQRSQQKSNYAMLYWAKGYLSETRGDSFINIVAPYENLTLTGHFYTNGSRQSGYEMAQKAIELDPQLSFIYACSTDVALGASQAIKEHKQLGKILVNGWGGGSAELAAIANGGLDVTVMRMNDDNGIAMAEAIKFDLEGRAKQIPVIFSGDFKLVDKNTSNEELIQLKQHAFRYSDRHKNYL